MDYQPNDILRMREVLRKSGKSPSAHYRDIKKGLYPPPVKLSPDPTTRAVGWVRRETETVDHAVIAGATADEVRELVTTLVRQRGSAA